MARAGGTHEFIFCQIQERKFHEFLEIFRASLKILWDPGSLPPLEYPTLAMILRYPLSPFGMFSHILKDLVFTSGCLVS